MGRCLCVRTKSALPLRMLIVSLEFIPSMRSTVSFRATRLAVADCYNGASIVMAPSTNFECNTHHKPTHHELMHHEPTHHELMHHEPTHHEPMHHKPTHHEPAHHEPMHHKPMHHEPTHYESMHHEPTHYKPTHHESMHYEPMHYKLSISGSSQLSQAKPPTISDANPLLGIMAARHVMRDAYPDVDITHTSLSQLDKISWHTGAAGLFFNKPPISGSSSRPDSGPSTSEILAATVGFISRLERPLSKCGD